ncbi:hypothetical protein [Aliarcobacter cibarius]|uniref:hypothetical protein n=1 Tax=Aliarcobacter cibarius TaxID=255507 RepID=UPI0010FEC722|nr:hypothetical protein [Aliarcobacter cibarius]TLT03336.1 hypothetical protein FE248_07525 [Aliarcobacter cibarius]
MKIIDAILECYGKGKFEEKFEVEIDGELFTGWYIYGLDTKEQLLQWFSKKQILEIYESGI